MKLKTNFAIKCDTLEQKKHIRKVLIDMGYEDDKKWNDRHIEIEYLIYWCVNALNEFHIFDDTSWEKIPYHDFCLEKNIEPIKHIEPQPVELPQPTTLEQEINDFKSSMRKRGFEIEIVFK